MKRIAITLLASAYAAHVFAQGANPSPTDQGKTAPESAQKSMRGCLWEGLQLTDDEKAKLKQIDDADRDSLRSAWAQIRIARESLDAALLANPENIADIQTKAQSGECTQYKRGSDVAASGEDKCGAHTRSKS